MSARDPLFVDLRGGRVRPAVCPTCGKVLDGAAPTSMDNPQGREAPHRPEVGDVALCNRCGACSRFTTDGQLESQSEDELDDDTRAILRRVRQAIRFVLPDGERSRYDG